MTERKPMAYQIGRTRIREGTSDKCCLTCNRLWVVHYVGGGTKNKCMAFNMQPATNNICDLYVSKEGQICRIKSEVMQR
jgi:hypothetical protein